MFKHLIDFSLLKGHRDYALIYFGQFISLIGTMISFVALPFQVYKLTSSTGMVGLLSLAQLIPLLFTSLLGGVCADRYNRRILVMFSELLLVLGCLWLALNAQSTHPSLIGIFMVSTLMSAITGLHRPAFESMTQQLVCAQDYKSVAVLASFKFSFCMIVGPAIAGLMIAHYSLAFTYFMDLLTFVISLVCLSLMHPLPSPAREDQLPILASLKEGLHFAFARQELMGSYYVDFIAMVFAMPNALFPAIADSFGGAKTLGFLYAAPAVGALFIDFFSGWTANIQSEGKAIAIAAFFWGLFMLGFGLSSSLWAALFCLALAGAADAVSGIFRCSLWNHVIPHEKRGRLAGIEMLSYLSGPKLGDTRAGALASFMGITTAITSGGILCMVGVVVCCVYMPKFWSYRSD